MGWVMMLYVSSIIWRYQKDDHCLDERQHRQRHRDFGDQRVAWRPL